MIIRWGIFFILLICYNTFMNMHEVTTSELKSSLDELIVFLQEHMLTKEESLGFATKDDLRRFATKDDLDNKLKGFATKDDLKSALLATKDDLENQIFELRYELKESDNKFATKEDLMQFKTEMMSVMDSIVTQHRTFDDELFIVRNQGFEHAGRLQIIEKKLNISC